MELKQRIIGIVVLLALGVIMVPLLFDSEVVMPLPAHIRSSVASNTAPAAKIVPKTETEVVAHQAQPIKPAIIQTSANKLLDETQEYPDVVVKADENEAQDQNTASENPEQKPDSHPLASSEEPTPDENSPQATPPEKVVDNKISLKEKLLKKEMVNMASLKEAPVKRDSFKLVSHNELQAEKTPAKETHLTDSSTEKELGRPVRLGEVSAEKEMEEMIRLENQQRKKSEFMASSGAWTIQLGIFSEQVNAKNLVAQLQAKGFNAFTERSDAQKNLHRVLVGPLADRTQANQIVMRLQKQMNMKGIVVRSRG